MKKIRKSIAYWIWPNMAKENNIPIKHYKINLNLYVDFYNVFTFPIAPFRFIAKVWFSVMIGIKHPHELAAGNFEELDSIVDEKIAAILPFWFEVAFSLLVYTLIFAVYYL